MGHRGSALAALLIAAAMFPAAAAYAVDGEIVFNQAKVNSGGVTPGDTAGFPVTISRRGKYKLSSGLTVASGKNGIVVTASEVTIDLNGFAIAGHSSGLSPSGIHAGPRNSLTVLNGTISGFRSYGVLTSGRFAVIEAMRIVGTNEGLQLGDDARIARSTISSNRASGIRCGLRCLVEQNVITLNGLDGIQLRNGGMVLGNTITSNKTFGIYGDIGGTVGFGNNALYGNNGGAPKAQVYGVISLHPNACSPACP
jgi:hypothetical protein